MRGEIIVGYDGRDPALDAVVLGRELAELTGEPLSLAIGLPYDPLLVGLEEYEQALDVDARRLVDLARPHLEGVSFETRAYGGDSATRLLHDLAERERAGAIVLGSTHRGPIGRLVPIRADPRAARSRRGRMDIGGAVWRQLQLPGHRARRPSG